MVLQVREIPKIRICHIFELFCLQKMTITLSKRSAGRYGDNNKVYDKMIDKLYVIVTARRKLDGFKW